MVPGQDLRQLRERLLAAVFLVAAHEHDVFSSAGALSTLDHDPWISGAAGAGENKQQEEDG